MSMEYLSYEYIKFLTESKLSALNNYFDLP